MWDFALEFVWQVLIRALPVLAFIALVSLPLRASGLRLRRRFYRLARHNGEPISSVLSGRCVIRGRMVGGEKRLRSPLAGQSVLGFRFDIRWEDLSRRKRCEFKTYYGYRSFLQFVDLGVRDGNGLALIQPDTGEKTRLFSTQRGPWLELGYPSDSLWSLLTMHGMEPMDLYRLPNLRVRETLLFEGDDVVVRGRALRPANEGDLKLGTCAEPVCTTIRPAENTGLAILAGDLTTGRHKFDEHEETFAVDLC